MIDLKVEHHVFIEDERHFIYFPTKDLLVEVDECLSNVFRGESTGSIDSQREIADAFSCLNTMDDITARIRQTPPLEQFRPTGITVLLNNFCNLSCSYCYASSIAEKKEVSEQDLMAAISFVVANAVEANQKSSSLCLHGWGEPSLSWSLVEESTRYFKELCHQHSVTPNITIVSNGVMDERKRHFIMANSLNVCISVDGVAEMHDCQRPMRDGGGSFRKVEETLLDFRKHNYQFGIRATATSTSLPGLPALARYLGEKFSSSCNGLFVDPINLLGKATNAAHLRPDWQEFVRIYNAMKAEAKKYGLNVTFISKDVPRSFACGVPNNFVLGFNGALSSCFECTEEHQASADYFLYGKFDSGRIASIDLAKINRIRSMSVDSLEVCKSCFARYRCGGDCLSRRLAENGDITRPSEWRCNAIQQIVQQELVELLDTSQQYGVDRAGGIAKMFGVC